jgi:hypothetical protein
LRLGDLKTGDTFGDPDWEADFLYSRAWQVLTNEAAPGVVNASCGQRFFRLRGRAEKREKQGVLGDSGFLGPPHERASFFTQETGPQRRDYT